MGGIVICRLGVIIGCLGGGAHFFDWIDLSFLDGNYINDRHIAVEPRFLHSLNIYSSHLD